MTIVTDASLSSASAIRCVVTGLAQVLFPRQGERVSSIERRRPRRSAPASSASRSRRPDTSGRGRRRQARATTPPRRAARTSVRRTRRSIDGWRPTSSACAATNPGAPGAGRARDHVGVRPRSAPLAGRRGVSGAARRRASAASDEARCARSSTELTEAAQLGIPRRAARQRADAESGARRSAIRSDRANR